MPRITVEGSVDAYIGSLKRLADDSEGIVKQAVYEGAKIVADEIRAELESVPTDEGHGTHKNPKAGPKKRELEDVAKNFGISTMINDNGYVNVKIGFVGDDYGSTKTKMYPKGQPILMLARSIESGTSFMRKNPFVARGVRKSRKRAEEAMEETINVVFQKTLEQQRQSKKELREKGSKKRT